MLVPTSDTVFAEAMLATYSDPPPLQLPDLINIAWKACAVQYTITVLSPQVLLLEPLF